MRWIRNAQWDAAWIWSGIPFAAMIVGIPLLIVGQNHSPVLLRYFIENGPPRLPIPWHSPERVLVCIFAAAVVVQMAHFMSPIAATWLNPSFRHVMLGRKSRYIWWPVALVVVSAVVGVATQFGWTGYDLHHPHQIWRITGPTNPFPIMVWTFWMWNAWHFSRQNFGVLLLCGTPRRWAWIAGFGGTMFAIVALPYVAAVFGVGFLAMLAMTGLISANHWLVELGMTARIASRCRWRQGAFIAVLIGAGLVGFLWTAVTPHGPTLIVMPGLIGAFLGLNFVHFWYDQWIYRFSDPAVRTTIGREVFHPGS